MWPTLKRIKELRPLEEPHRNASYKELEKSIRRHGVHTPAVVTQDGIIVDGGRRFRILEALNEELIPVNVLKEEYTQEELWKLRAELNVRHRCPSPVEIQRASGLDVPISSESVTVPPNLQALIEDILAAKGFGPQLLSLIARQITVVLPHQEDPMSKVLTELQDFFRNGNGDGS